MFLALREIKKEKLRYGLIITMIVMITYLLFILLGLMNGLSNENTAALKSWDTRTVWLNKNANDRLSQSTLMANQVPNYDTKHMALIGDVPGQLKRTQGAAHKQDVQLVGLKNHDFIAQKKIQLVSGHWLRNDCQLVLDESLRQQGYHLGTKVSFNGNKQLKVVGFARDAKLNIAPIAYTTLSQWQKLHGGPFVGSALISDKASHHHYAGMHRYGIKQFINKLPGYTAQNTTFEMMIGFLLVISLVVIAVFLYILTMQKTKQYALLRAQGIPSEKLVGATIAQSLILIISGVVIAVVLTGITIKALPAGVPVLMDPHQLSWMVLAILGIGLLSSCLPTAMIMRIDPLDALK